MEFLATKPGLERLSRDDFIERVKRLHYIIMPYRLDYYETAPSGTLLDAIAWGIPIIATKLPIFERAFQTYGNIGYLFQDREELKKLLAKLVRAADHGAYASQLSNLSQARLARGPEKLAADYRDICARGARLMLGPAAQNVRAVN